MRNASSLARRKPRLIYQRTSRAAPRSNSQTNPGPSAAEFLSAAIPATRIPIPSARDARQTRPIFHRRNDISRRNGKWDGPRLRGLFVRVGGRLGAVGIAGSPPSSASVASRRRRRSPRERDPANRPVISCDPSHGDRSSVAKGHGGKCRRKKSFLAPQQRSAEPFFPIVGLPGDRRGSSTLGCLETLNSDTSPTDAILAS